MFGFMLVVSSLVCLIKTPIVWGIFLALWVCSIILFKKETNKYMKAIFIDGIAILSFTAFVSPLIINDLSGETGKSMHTFFALILVSIVVLYELFVLIRICTGTYTRKNIALRARDTSKVNKPLIAFFASCGAIIGIRTTLVKDLLPPYISQNIDIVLIVVASFYSIMLLQKYLILKILKYR